MPVEEEIEMLADAGLLTERQAEAFVYREIELVPREAAADAMGISPSTLDDYRADAVAKVDAATATIDAIEQLRDQVPDDA